MEVKTSASQAEDQPKGQDTLVTSEIGKDVPNPVAVEGVEGDQPKADEEDEQNDDDNEAATDALEGSHPSGDKENPVVVDVRPSASTPTMNT